MKIILNVVFFIFSNALIAQEGLEKQIEQFYSDINSGEEGKVKSHFHELATITALGTDTVVNMKIVDFLQLCPKFKSGKFEEKIVRIEYLSNKSHQLRYDVYFDFHIDGEYSHSGVDEITFVADNDYNYLIDKIYSSEYEFVDKMENFESDKAYADYSLNKWHLDVAEYNLDDYFGFMHTNFIFLGTDPSERWTKQEFYKFCKPYFTRKSTWNFKVNWRNTYQSKGVIWFEESLDTWMNECRGSGVLVYEENEWKLIHYNLTVLIENEKMKKFNKLRAK